MKTKIKIISFFLLINIGTWITTQKASAQVSVSFQVFYDDLSPYGYWVDNPDYGYVWVPNVAAGFMPYGTNGYWVFTDAGWTWVSNYPWGWAPFHYGRWYNDPMYGPIWVPGNEWGPGWVIWRGSEGYYGWAPIEPGISYSVAYNSGYRVPNDRWVFVRDRDFGRTNINNYYLNSSGNTTIINNSIVINNIQVDKSRNVTYNKGPERSEVEKRAGKTFTPIAIKENNKPGQSLSKEQLQLYRPQVEKNIPSGSKPAPSKVVKLKDVKTPAQRTSETVPQKSNQPANQQPSLPQRTGQPTKQKSLQPQQANPAKKSELEKQPLLINPAEKVGGEKSGQPIQQKPVQPKQVSPPQKGSREKQPILINPSENMGGEKQPQRPGEPIKPTHSQPKNKSEQPAQQLPPPQRANPHQNIGREKQPPRAVAPTNLMPSQQQRRSEPPQQQPSQPQEANPPQNRRGEERPH